MIPPLRAYSYPSKPPPPISNGNVFQYPINKEKTVKHLRDRKVIIANVFKNSNEIRRQRQQNMIKVPCI